MTTGEKIYEARKKSGMTQEELAERLGVTRQAVSKWEQDIAFPETDKIIELCKMFSLSSDELLLGSDGAECAKASETEDGQHGAVWDRKKLHYEYISKTRLFGLPLVHINFGLGHYRAKGIIAIGNIATGFVSFGLLATGLVAFGLLAVGLLAFGTIALGLLMGAGAVATGALVFGGVAIGILSFGGLSIGYVSVGGMAVGQYAAGGYAVGYVAIGHVGAEGANAFLMPKSYSELCTFLDTNVGGWLATFLKGIAVILGD